MNILAAAEVVSNTLRRLEGDAMDVQKNQMLAEEGFVFDKELFCFVNKKAGKIFSEAWIDEKNVNTVQITLSLPHNPAMWKLFLNPEQPHEEMRTALFAKYGKTP